MSPFHRHNATLSSALKKLDTRSKTKSGFKPKRKVTNNVKPKFYTFLYLVTVLILRILEETWQAEK